MIILSYIAITLCLIMATGLIMHADGRKENGFLAGICGSILYGLAAIAMIFNAIVHDVNVHRAAQCASTKHFEMGDEEYVNLKGEFVRCKDLKVIKKPKKAKKIEETTALAESCSTN